MRFFVSWNDQGLCGNKTFDTNEEMRKFIRQNRYRWQSYSQGTYDPDKQDIPGVHQIQPIEDDRPPVGPGGWLLDTNE